jgi:hypothetical protein
VTGIHPIMTGMVYATTENTGGSCQVAGPEGAVQFHRVDPHGVVMQFAGNDLSIGKEHLPVLARYLAAAAMLLGVPLNEGWDSPDGGQTTGGFRV